MQLSLDEYLYRWGYGREHATKFAQAYEEGGLDAAVALTNDWGDNNEHGYANELREAIAIWKATPQKVKVQDDGALYFVLDDDKRFMECVIDYEDNQWVLRANDSEIARF